ncbi:MAG TPA: hypothetical protein VEC19_09145 [Usitatibacter sp.]|nr:hypothetical protein [Usitatibacter sp.]
MILGVLLGVAAPAFAGLATVCTITVNSADERDVFKRFLPADRYRFVELAQMGRSDWLGDACRRGVQCDVLLVSGHFAGTQFYSSRHGEHLPVDELERAACSESCSGLFSRLKEVYLFGCDTLKAQPVVSAMPEVVRGLRSAGMEAGQAARLAAQLSERHGESARGRMRRIFAGVPLIYGFSSLAPYGRVAGPMLEKHFESHGIGAVGSGVPSAPLLALFGPVSMVATRGQQPGDPDSAYREEACRYYDEALDRAHRLSFMRSVLAGDAGEVRMAFDRIERFVGSLTKEERSMPAVAEALGQFPADTAARSSYLALARETHDPALRVRMIALARSLGWLDAAQHRAELAATIGDVLAAREADFGEVDLVCGLNAGREFDGEMAALAKRAGHSTPAAAALACLGSEPHRAGMLRALASGDEAQVRIAEAYFRHRPMTEATTLRGAIDAIAEMKQPLAQARALAVVARHHVDDAPSLEALMALFARSTHLAVQRAIAEIFIRAGSNAFKSGELATVLRRHRLRSREGDDVIEALLKRLDGA